MLRYAAAASLGAGDACPRPVSYSELARFAALPHTKTTPLQVGDMDDSDIVASLAEKAGTPKEAQHCTDSSGWLDLPTWESIKARVAERFLPLVEVGVAEMGGAGRVAMDVDGLVAQVEQGLAAAAATAVEEDEGEEGEEEGEAEDFGEDEEDEEDEDDDDDDDEDDGEESGG
jgi:hypothetical protein